MTQKGEPILCDLEAEKAVLEAVLVDPQFAWGKIGKYLKPDDFQLETHQWIFQAVADLFHAGSPVDLITLADELDRKGRLVEIGGAPYLSGLLATAATAYHVEHYAKIVSRLSRLRSLAKMAKETYVKATQPDADPSELEAEVVRAVVSKARSTMRVYTVHEALDVAEAKQVSIANGEQQRGLDPLLPSIRASQPHGVWQQGMISLISGDPGVGKSWLAFQIAVLNALLGKHIAYIGTELTIEYLADRLTMIMANIVPTLPQNIVDRIGMNLNIPITNAMMLRGEADGQIGLLREAADQILGERQLILVPEGLEINEVVQLLRVEALREGPLDGVVLDYLQLMRDKSKSWRSTTSEQDEVAEISRQYCTETGTNLVAVTAFRKRQTRRPTLEDIRGTGLYGYAASWAASLWVDEEVGTRDPLKESKDKGLRLLPHKASRVKGWTDIADEGVPVCIDPDTGIFRELLPAEVIKTSGM